MLVLYIVMIIMIRLLQDGHCVAISEITYHINKEQIKPNECKIIFLCLQSPDYEFCLLPHVFYSARVQNVIRRHQLASHR